MSVIAPACSASRNPGIAHAVCTRPIKVGESVRRVICQLAAAMCMKLPTFDTSAAIHTAR